MGIDWQIGVVPERDLLSENKPVDGHPLYWQTIKMD